MWTCSFWWATFELCPYGIWNNFFWTTSFGIVANLNFVPMGFETTFNKRGILVKNPYLNFVPMGFETCFPEPPLPNEAIWTLSLWDLKLASLSSGSLSVTTIWTLSLWDLKPSKSFERYVSFAIFELCPYGIWNLQNLLRDTSLLQYLNFVPMGFETDAPFMRYGEPKYLNFVPMGFETQITTQEKETYNIWTLSLWDLKQVKIGQNRL